MEWNLEHSVLLNHQVTWTIELYKKTLNTVLKYQVTSDMRYWMFEKTFDFITWNGHYLRFTLNNELRWVFSIFNYELMIENKCIWNFHCMICPIIYFLCEDIEPFRFNVFLVKSHWLGIGIWIIFKLDLKGKILISTYIELVKLVNIFNCIIILSKYHSPAPKTLTFSAHNKKVTNPDTAQQQQRCNCRNKTNCPIPGKCCSPCIVYKASNKYIGMTEGIFKMR